VSFNYFPAELLLNSIHISYYSIINSLLVIINSLNRHVETAIFFSSKFLHTADILLLLSLQSHRPALCAPAANHDNSLSPQIQKLKAKSLILRNCYKEGIGLIKC